MVLSLRVYCDREDRDWEGGGHGGQTSDPTGLQSKHPNQITPELTLVVTLTTVERGRCSLKALIKEVPGSIPDLNNLPFQQWSKSRQGHGGQTSDPTGLQSKHPNQITLRLTLVETLTAVERGRREMLHSYGFEHMPTLYNLEKAGLFKRQESKSNWLMISKALQLIVSESEASRPDDISYIFSGYAPLSIRIVQHAIRSGWRSIEEVLRLLPGPHVDLKRGGSTNSSSFDRVPSFQSNLDSQRLAKSMKSIVWSFREGLANCLCPSSMREALSFFGVRKRASSYQNLRARERLRRCLLPSFHASARLNIKKLNPTPPVPITLSPDPSTPTLEGDNGSPSSIIDIHSPSSVAFPQFFIILSANPTQYPRGAPTIPSPGVVDCMLPPISHSELLLNPSSSRVLPIFTNSLSANLDNEGKGLHTHRRHIYYSAHFLSDLGLARGKFMSHLLLLRLHRKGNLLIIT
ncbi:hypothetical protein KSP40_PGU022728 [Platanthera guangdongensis]|uniref:Maturase n=1 Tax=Platanthera guangdongensis TaxID=2320717 RepID=A0ABR2LPW4_9ASPA